MPLPPAKMMPFNAEILSRQIGGRAPYAVPLVETDGKFGEPWMLAVLADKIKGKIEQEGRKLLEKK